MTHRIVIDRLSVALDAVPGVSGPAFRDALRRELGRIELPEDLPDRTISSLSLPAIEARPGDTAERLAARTAQGIARALKGALP